MAHPAELDRLCVVLVRVRNPLNIGAAARAMSNFGFSRLRVVNPYPVAFREARSAVGASPVLAGTQEFPSVAEAVADCSLVVGTTSVGSRELQHPMRRLQVAARLIRRRLPSGRVALLFGSEKVGLSNADLSHCHWLVRIPTREEHRSMNLGQAVAVCLYELVRGSSRGKLSGLPEKTARSREEQRHASAGGQERLTSVFLDALRSSGYLPPRSKAPTEEKVRRLVRRLHLSANDAETLLGMLRQIDWKLRSGQRPT